MSRKVHSYYAENISVKGVIYMVTVFWFHRTGTRHLTKTSKHLTKVLSKNFLRERIPMYFLKLNSSGSPFYLISCSLGRKFIAGRL